MLSDKFYLGTVHVIQRAGKDYQLRLFCTRGLLLALLALWGAMAYGAPVMVPEAPTVLVIDGAGMVPLRPLAEICGATVTTNTGQMTVTRDKHTLICTIGKTAAKQDGKDITLPKAPLTFNGVGYVPLRALVTALGGTLDAPKDAEEFQVTFPGMAPFILAQQPSNGVSIKGAQVDLYLAAIADGRLTRLTYTYNAPCDSLSFSRDGATLYMLKENSLTSRAINTPNKVPAIQALGKVGWPCLQSLSAPDKSLLCSIANPEAADDAYIPEIGRVDAEGAYTHLADGLYLAGSADGKFIAYTKPELKGETLVPALHIMQADGTHDRRVGEGIPGQFTPDGATLCYLKLTDAQGKDLETPLLAQLNVADGKERFADTPTPIAVNASTFVSISPDGARLVYAKPNVGLWVMNLDLTHAQQLTKDATDHSPCFSPDGKMIAFLRDASLMVMPVDGSRTTPIAPEMMVQCFAFTADSSQLVFSGITPPPASPQRPNAGKPTDKEVEAARAAGTRTATIKTDRGTITVELYGKDAPLSVANFIKLAQAKFYDGLTFHRVERNPEFNLIQGGDPNGNGSGGPGYSIKLEIVPTLKHVAGALAMARSQNPDSAGSQFYITAVAIPQLDGNYAVFGKVTKGLDVVEKMQVGDKIISITVK